VQRSAATVLDRPFFQIWGWAVAHPLAPPMVGKAADRPHGWRPGRGGRGQPLWGAASGLATAVVSWMLNAHGFGCGLRGRRIASFTDTLVPTVSPKYRGSVLVVLLELRGSFEPLKFACRPLKEKVGGCFRCRPWRCSITKL
jgi:hypothetical protein